MPWRFSSPERWEDLNTEMAQVLGVPESLTFRVYPGTALALQEAVQGLIQFYPHKRVLGQFKGQTPAFSFLMPSLYKDGFEMQTHLPDMNPDEFLQNLKAETNFVLSSQDHPVTGQIFACESRRQSLAAKKIFSIEISHSAWLRDINSWSLNPFEIRLLEVSPDLTYLVAGARFRAAALVAPQMSWDPAYVLKVWQQTQSQFKEDQVVVENFIKQLPKGWKAWPMEGPRLWDRAFIYNAELNSEFFVQAGVLSTSLCALQERNGFFDWWLPPPAQEIIRGGLIIDLSKMSSNLNLSFQL